ncbi:TolC family protein [Aureliella helgolandensis]|uniref:Cobalt-zinc-cadmium resistance protein CzcC n=1 Tax=Aureliella helgolandensis TaxID=2527968 RepID=A0A518G1B1_9BACT|nr:TolC family protein [Aureliella helgolandensis]QDV22366.1 Cobalt-zinc-cadmium resistance protein CzcC precursor [Aureliella helgolandensis]
MLNRSKIIARTLLLGSAMGSVGCATQPGFKLPGRVATSFPSEVEASQLPTSLAANPSSIGTPAQSHDEPQPTVQLAAATLSIAPPIAGAEAYDVASDTAYGMTLAEFESLAFANNPTIRGLAATTQKAAGYRTQVGLYANPTVGYQGTQIADQDTDQHVAFVEQEFVTGGKLQLNRRVINEALRAQLLELEAQKLRVSTDIHVKFAEALAAQRRVRLIEEFQTVTDKGLELAELRKQALEGSQVDVLQAKVQKNEIDLTRQQAYYALEAAWRELAALCGVPDLPQQGLVGELPSMAATLDWDEVRATMLASTPEYQAAQVRVQQARANLTRQGVQAIPNLTVQFGAGVDNGTNNGLVNLQVGAPIPVFNKNQGNIAAARAEYCRAMMEVERIQSSIKSRLAAVARDYDSAAAAVTKYSVDILPSAQETLQLAELAYKSGETSFVQVLVSRRTYFDSNLQYLAAQSQLSQARSKIDGFVLTGGLDSFVDNSGDDSLRGMTFSQQ